MNEDSPLLSFNDFIGVPIVLVIFFLLIKWLAPHYIRDPKLLRMFYWGLLLRLVGMVLSILFYLYIQKINDTYTYFEYARVISRVISTSSIDDVIKFFSLEYADLPFHTKAKLPDNYSYPATLFGSKFMILTTAIVSYFTFDSYIAIAMVFTLFGYLGTWLIFYRLVKLYPALYTYFFLFIICWPSAFFWGSAVMKEPLCMGCVGIIFYLMFSKVRQPAAIWKSILLALPFAYYLFNIKSYLLISLCVAFVFSCIIARITKIKDAQLRRSAYLLIALLIIFPLVYIFLDSKRLLASGPSQHVLQYIFAITRQQLAIGNSKYDLGEIELSPVGVISYLLAALNVGVLGPYFFQITSLQLFISGSESLVMLLILVYTIYKTPVLSMIYIIKKEAILVFCIVFVLIVGMQIGAISFNYGTLVRYKMPLVPFFFAFFIIILYRAKSNKMAIKKIS